MYNLTNSLHLEPQLPPLLCLYGVVVSVLATSPKGRVFDPGQGDGFLRAIKIRSTPSFGWDIKPEVLGMNSRPVEAAVLRRQSHAS
jgi:hypothetical protein